MRKISPLLERENETSRMEAALNDVLAGRSRTIVIEGQPGIGKSSLLRHAEAAARSAGADVLSAVCSPVARDLPYSVLYAWFRRRAREVERGASPFDGPASKLRDLVEGEGSADPSSIAYALHWVIGAMAEDRPVVLSIDDAQWADATSLAAVAHLLGQPDLGGVLVLLATRPRQPGEIDAGLAGLLARRDAQLIRPAALSLDAVRRLVGDAAADQVYAASDGVPFYVHELIESDASPSAPERVIASIRQRFALHPAETKCVAEAIAVFGSVANRRLVSAFCGLDGRALDAALDRLAGDGLATVTEPGLAISHPIVEASITQDIPSATLAQLHARAARVLAQAGYPVAVQAVHEALAPVGDDERRADVLREAARLALESGAPELAASYLRSARAELAAWPERAAELAVVEGQARVRYGDSDTGIALIRESLTFVLEPIDRAERYVDLGDAAYMGGRLEAAARAYELALGELTRARESGEQANRRVLSRVAIGQLSSTGDPFVLDRQLIESLLAQPADDDTHVDRTLLAVAALRDCLVGRVSDRTRRMALRAWADGRFLEGETSDSPATFMLSGALNYLEQFEVGTNLLDAVIAEAVRHSNLQVHATASYARGAMRQRSGRLRAAQADLELARSGAALGWRTYIEAAQYFLVRGHLYTGDIEAAEIVLAHAEAGSGSSPFGGVIDYTRLAILHATGKHEAVLELGGRMRDSGLLVLAKVGEDWRREIALSRHALGDIDGALALITEALEQSSAARAPLKTANLLLSYAQLDPDRARAVESLRQVIALAGGRRVYQRAHAQVLLGERLAQDGGGADAERLLHDALGYARREGVHPLVRRCERALQSIGSSVTVSPLDKRLARLTPVEFAIAERAARRESNRSIAQAQFVTVKTVEYHLGKVFRKLGVASRSELAEALDVSA